MVYKDKKQKYLETLPEEPTVTQLHSVYPTANLNNASTIRMMQSHVTNISPLNSTKVISLHQLNDTMREKDGRVYIQLTNYIYISCIKLYTKSKTR